MFVADASASSLDASFSSGTVIAFAAAGVLFIFAVRRIIHSFSNPPSASSADESAQIFVPTMSGVVTEAELRDGTGEDGKALLIAVKDPFSEAVSVFDVSSGRDFYGPGGPYHMFAGKNATHGLAKSSTDPASVTGDISALTEHEKDTHMQWYAKYTSKYPLVGNLVADGAREGYDTESTVTADTKKDA